MRRCPLGAWSKCLPMKVLIAVVLALLGSSSVSAVKTACPSGCNTFGTCYEELGRCDCPWNQTGLACDQHDPRGFCVRMLGVDNPVNTCNDGDAALCINGCNARGACKGGFCHCQEGYFGTDCSLSYDPTGNKLELLSGLNYQPSSRGPKVYVYELPPEFHVKRNIHKVDRPPLHLALLERLLSSGHRHADGATADYYYVPVSGRDLKKGFLLQPMLQYISQTWPYWNETQGHRHIIPMEGDVGACELPVASRRFAINATWLAFWGMYDFHPSWKHTFAHGLPCFNPGRDIVVPFMAMSSHDRFVIETPLHPRNRQRPRNTTFFFAGGICGSGNRNARPPHCTFYKQIRYSGYVRQAVYENFHNRSGWRVVGGTDDYARDYASSLYCLAAAGGGWGKRGIVAAMYGCVPVAATDFLYEAFEPEMSWERFGVRISQAQIPQLADILAAVSPAELKEKQRRTACAAQHFHWSSNLGGILGETGEFDAFASIMAILRVRRKHPELLPAQYYDKDPEFRDFVDCVPVDPARKAKPLCTMYVGPGMELRGFEDACPEAKFYFRRKMGPAGGAVCAGASDIAHCTRFEPAGSAFSGSSNGGSSSGGGATTAAGGGSGGRSDSSSTDPGDASANADVAAVKGAGAAGVGGVKGVEGRNTTEVSAYTVAAAKGGGTDAGAAEAAAVSAPPPQLREFTIANQRQAAAAAAAGAA